jgi:hypothetical protein
MMEAHAIARGISMPFGTTLVCVARKPIDPGEQIDKAARPAVSQKP